MAQKKNPVEMITGQKKDVDATFRKKIFTLLLLGTQDKSLTMPGLSGNTGIGAENSSANACQSLKNGIFSCAYAPEKHSASSVISGRVWDNAKPFGEIVPPFADGFRHPAFFAPHDILITEKISEVPMFKSATSPLTSCRESGKVVAPESTRCGNRLSVSPRDGKNIAAYSAVEAPIISDGQLSHIGGDTTSSNREDWRLRRAGERCNPAFSFNPKIDEVPMFKSATSPSSVPLCLRHGMKNSALYDAQYLAAFLQQVVSTIATDNGPLDEKAYLGCRLCFDLLRDKLAIAAGEMPDPEEGGNE